MKVFQPKTILLACLVLSQCAGHCHAAETAQIPKPGAKPPAQAERPAGSEFLRFTKSGLTEGKLETAVKQFRREADRAVVSLVAVVHVGDAGYYDRLQKFFESFDAVLYEMIRERDVEPTPAERSGHPISQLQVGMKNLLELEFQLDRIDYSRKNFVHADLDPASFEKLQADRGETIFGLLLKAALEEQRRQSADPSTAMNPFALLGALLSSDRGPQLKMMLGSQMSQMENVLAGIDQTPDGKGSAILSGRNEHAMKVLAEQLAKGKRRLAIFYGAGHMPDLEKRLKEIGFKNTGEQWFAAWDIRKKPKPEVPAEAAR